MPKIFKHKSKDAYKLRSGCWADIPFYHVLQNHIASRIHLFVNKCKFTLRELCGDEFWLDINPVHLRRIAGMCFRTMVGENRFPIKLRKNQTSRTKYYDYSK